MARRMVTAFGMSEVIGLVAVGDAEQEVFLVDEAYFDFVEAPGHTSALRWIDERDNVVVVRTFSKIYGMAGLRLGYGMASPATARRVRCMAINAREFQGPGIHQRRNAVGPGQVQRFVKREGVDILTGQKSLLIFPLTLDPASTQYPIAVRNTVGPVFDLGHGLCKALAVKKTQGSGAPSDTFKMLVAVGKARKNKGAA